jgi:hypothetical protein
LFPEACHSYHADRVFGNKLIGGGVIIAVSEGASGSKDRSGLECFNECVWVEDAMTDILNVFNCNHYLSADVKSDTIKKYFNF